MELAGAVTDSGTVRAGPDTLNAATKPPAGAALDKETVQVVDAAETTVEGEQMREDTSTGATRVSVALAELPFNDAVSWAVEFAVMAARVAVNVALVWLAGINRDAGTLTEALLLDSVTDPPPAGAARVRLTEQLVDAPEETMDGEQVTALTRGSGVTVIVDVPAAPPAEAVMTAEVELATEPATAENVVRAVPAVMVTEG